MRRCLLVTAVLVAGCTRSNPAFDRDSGEDVAEGSDEVEGSDELVDTSEESESGEADLPGPACELQPSAGLDLKFGDSSYFGGSCPNTVDVWADVSESGGGMLLLATCSEGCQACSGAHPLSTFPLDVTAHLPDESSLCLRLQASVSLGPSPEVCQWGALSLFDGVDGTPYVIAVAHGSEPTPLGLETLAGLIPDPIKFASCSCDDVGQGHDCCYQAEGPPEFLAYPWGDELLLPGDSAPITIANEAGLMHEFEVFQAERLHACESPERSLSWAVYSVLP